MVPDPNLTLARAQGDIYYFTGKSCKYGHISKRLVSNRKCYECTLEEQRKPSNKLKEYRKRYHIDNFEIINSRGCQWAKDNRSKHNANTAKYRAAKLKATPKWLTDEDWSVIRTIYETCPKGYEIDHIIPLQGKLVCGLHVPLNLRAIPMRDNRSKGNKLISN